MFWVVILRYADGRYYTGHTDNLEKCIGQCQAGECEGYAATPRPVELAWTQECVTLKNALSAEMQIKGWSLKKRSHDSQRLDGVSHLAKSKSVHLSTSSGRTDLLLLRGLKVDYPLNFTEPLKLTM